MPQLSKACGRFLDEKASAFLIPLFVKKTGIDVSEYDTENIHSFNDFFSRKILEGRRPVDLDPTHLIAPCDGLLSVWPITKEGIFPVKQSAYTVSSLLRDEKLAGGTKAETALFSGSVSTITTGTAMQILEKRAAIERFPGCFIQSGLLHFGNVPVLSENSREYTCIHTTHFGTLLQMEVGAMLVGRIVNYKEAGEAARGEGKGHVPVRRLHHHPSDEKGTCRVQGKIFCKFSGGHRDSSKDGRNDRL